MSDFNKMQILKRRFFAMRNGVIADTLRRGGSTFRIIFGLNLPQLVDIARDYGHDPQLAFELWNNTACRESLLLAPMLLQPDDVDKEQLSQMISSINDIEVADTFCHRFLRKHPDALNIATSLEQSPRDMDHYIATRLMLNIVRQHPTEALQLAQRELDRNCPFTHRLAHQLLSSLPTP